MKSTMVKRIKDKKLRLRNFDVEHGRSESGALVKSRKGSIGVEGGKGICFQWKEKGQRLKETDAVSATKPKIVHKREHSAATLLSQPYHEVE